ncbi:MAG: aldo/keto reductase [Microthrixaceae bacterium]|nr:aldo/keto reductase [Microthrixaceae bacterium]
MLVDNADVYGEQERGAAESLLGRVLSGRSGWADDLVLATKAGIRPGVPYDASGDHLVAACDASLRRLGVEVIDLFQLHRVDLYTPPEETAAALAHLREAGKVREVGVSNASVAQLDDLERLLPFPLAAVQAECSLLDRRPIFDGVLDWCRRRGAVPLAYSPLASGRLAAPGGDVPPDLTERLDALAAREGRPVTVVALAFLLAHPSRPVPIVGTQRPERLAELAGATTVRLDRADVYGLIEAAQGHELP